jgi:Glycosyltransferase
MLIEQGNQVDVAFQIVRDVKPEIQAMGCKVYNLPFRRSPFSLDNYQAYKILKKIIREGGYDIVHTHTPVASACVRFACRKQNKIKVIYTAHGFHFYKGAPLKNWIIYYHIEKWLSRYTDLLITINQEDYQSAKKWKAKQVEYVPGVGIDINKFCDVVVDRTTKRKELGISEDAIIILSIGEINKNKNHKIVINALKKLENPQIHYILCGHGNLEENLKNLSVKNGLMNQVHFLGFREDIPELCKTSDLLVFPSFREGLPISVMEAMASGLSIIASRIRGNLDLIEEGKGGYLIKPNDEDELANAINQVINDPSRSQKMCEYNQEKIKGFSKEVVEVKLRRLYETISKM